MSQSDMQRANEIVRQVFKSSEWAGLRLIDEVGEALEEAGISVFMDEIQDMINELRYADQI